MVHRTRDQVHIVSQILDLSLDYSEVLKELGTEVSAPLASVINIGFQLDIDENLTKFRSSIPSYSIVTYKCW